MSSAAINIGTNKESIIEARKALQDILSSDAEQKTKRAAIRCLSTLCQVNGSVISGCNIGYSALDDDD